jgi:hypothetical protein
MGDWRAKMALCFAQMMVHLAFPQKAYKHTLAWSNQRGSILPQLRQNLIDKALEGGATHLLFIDSDMTFPPEIATDWLEADYPVLAANCPTKSIPSWPTARLKDSTIAGTPLYSDVGAGRFQKVWRVGTGIMMLRRDVLEKLPRPAFTPYWHQEKDGYVYEDWALCEHIEAAGFPIRVDNKLSLEVGHDGAMEYTWDHITMSRKAKAAA